MTRKHDNKKGTVAKYNAAETPPTAEILYDDNSTTTAADARRLGKADSTHSAQGNIWSTTSARDHAPNTRRKTNQPGLPRMFT